MKTLAVILMALTPLYRASAAERFTCNLGVLTKAERQRDQELAHLMRAAADEALGVLRQQDIETLEAVLEGRRPQGPRSGATFRKRVQRAIERVRLAWRNKHGID